METDINEYKLGKLYGLIDGFLSGYELRNNLSIRDTAPLFSNIHAELPENPQDHISQIWDYVKIKTISYCNQLQMYRNLFDEQDRGRGKLT